MKLSDNVSHTPQEIEHYFMFDENELEFDISKFEEYLVQDLYRHDHNSKVKLNTNVTKDVIEEIKLYGKLKKNNRFSIKGETRDGKSYIGLKIGDTCFDINKIGSFENVERFVCGNQSEYRIKLQEAQFGEFYLVDEKSFTRAGHGANLEGQQLLDVNNIIAKKNISVVYITPQRFLTETGSTLGFSTYGRNNDHWISRALVYKFKDGYPYLVGYALFDIGSLFRKYGCYIYKDVGGCNNLQKKKSKDIDKKLLEFSKCFDKYNKKDLVENHETCPFYKICKHPIAKYEKKKDTWIDKEMKGGMKPREEEMYKVAIKCLLSLEPEKIGDNKLKLNKVSSGKDLDVKTKPKIKLYSNTQWGIAETEEINTTIKSFAKDIDFLDEILKLIDDQDLTDQVYETLKDKNAIEHKPLPKIEDQRDELIKAFDKGSEEAQQEQILKMVEENPKKYYRFLQKLKKFDKKE